MTPRRAKDDAPREAADERRRLRRYFRARCRAAAAAAADAERRCAAIIMPIRLRCRRYEPSAEMPRRYAATPPEPRRAEESERPPSAY